MILVSSSSSSSGLEAGSGSSGAFGSSCVGCRLSSVPSGAVVYAGGGSPPSCDQDVTFDGVVNYWFAYEDGTGSSFSHEALPPGCAGPDSCSFFATGSGFTGYGAGIGITLDEGAIFDASKFTGLVVTMFGTTTGTLGSGYLPSNNTVHVKFVTGGPDGGGDPREGDDYGGSSGEMAVTPVSFGVNLGLVSFY
jgi:hypothetical protein